MADSAQKPTETGQKPLRMGKSDDPAAAAGYERRSLTHP